MIYNILLISNNQETIEQLSKILAELYSLHRAEDFEEVIPKLAEIHPDAILIDNLWPLKNYVDLILEIKKTERTLPIIFLNTPGQIKEAVFVLKAGAASVLSKPVEREKLLELLDDLIKLKSERRISLKVPADFPWFLGSSSAICGFVWKLEKAAEFEKNITLVSPRGAPVKEIAGIIHQNSFYSREKFWCFNFRQVLSEKEFRNKFSGYLEEEKNQGQPGTIYLEGLDFNKGEFCRFLKMLLEKSQKELLKKLRFIIGLTQDEYLKSGFNKEDFFVGKMPSLEERREDIPFLVTELVENLNLRFSKKVKHFSSEVLDFFINYPWPGQTQEMEALLGAAIAAISPEAEVLTLKEVGFTLPMFFEKTAEAIILQRNFNLDEALKECRQDLEKFLSEKIGQSPQLLSFFIDNQS